jgi:hypothetical protein
MRVHSRDCCIEQGTEAEQRAASHYDRIGHSSVQPWSAGAIFPCVVTRVERYQRFEDMHAAQAARTDDDPRMYAQVEDMFYAQPLEARLRVVSYVLTLDGHSEEYATREDAEMVARAMLRDAGLRAQWNRREVSHA